jgi:hypothetical protein
MSDVIGRLAELMPLLAALVVVVATLRAVATPADRPTVLAAGLALGAEFLVAGGLLRLFVLGTLEAVGLAAAAVGVRTVIGIGLRVGVRAGRGAVPGPSA